METVEGENRDCKVERPGETPCCAELFYDTRLEIVRGEGIYIGVAKMSVDFWCLSVRFIPKAAAELE